MKIIFSGKVKNLFKNKLFNPQWWNAVGAGWELGKGIAEHDTPRARKMRTLQEFLNNNPEYADAYYGRSQGGLSQEQIQKIWPTINWTAIPNMTPEKVQRMLRKREGYQILLEVGAIQPPVSPAKKKTNAPEETFSEPKDVIPESTFPEPHGDEDLPY